MEELDRIKVRENGGNSDLGKAKTIIGTTSVVPSTIKMGTELIRTSANYTDDIAKIAKISSRTTTGFGITNMVITTIDGATSKGDWKNHHTADLIIVCMDFN